MYAMYACDVRIIVFEKHENDHTVPTSCAEEAQEVPAGDSETRMWRVSFRQAPSGG
jgi:hypothetical protein